MEQIAPRLRSATPQCVSKVGAEDDAELLQDGLAMAAHLMDGLERRGKEVPPSSVAYYTIQHLKSGRRSYSTGSSDVMGSATQIRQHSVVLSLETEVGFDEEMQQPMTIEEVLTDGRHEDVAMAAGRNIDWELFLATHDVRYICLVYDLASGHSMLDTARACGMTYAGIRELRARLVEDLEEFLGDEAIADSSRVPKWLGNLRQDHEKMACRADRRRG